MLRLDDRRIGLTVNVRLDDDRKSIHIRRADFVVGLRFDVIPVDDVHGRVHVDLNNLRYLLDHRWSLVVGRRRISIGLNGRFDGGGTDERQRLDQLVGHVLDPLFRLHDLVFQFAGQRTHANVPLARRHLLRRLMTCWSHRNQ